MSQSKTTNPAVKAERDRCRAIIALQRKNLISEAECTAAIDGGMSPEQVAGKIAAGEYGRVASMAAAGNKHLGAAAQAPTGADPDDRVERMAAAGQKHRDSSRRIS